MTNGNDSARAKHLESLASGAKRYVLNEVLEVSEAVAAELANIGEVEFIEGTQTAATGAWTGVTKDSSLKKGKFIVYRLPYAGSGNATLNLTLADGTKTGAKNVYRYGSTRLSTQYAANYYVPLIYNGTYWFALADYDVNYYDRIRVANAIAVAEGAVQAVCFVGSTDGTNYKQLSAGATFDINYPVYYNSTATADDANMSTGLYFALGSINLRTLTGDDTRTFATQAPLYLKGSISGSIFTVHSDVITTAEPTADDGYFYLRVGSTYSDYQAYITLFDNKFYAYNNGFKVADPFASDLPTASATVKGGVKVGSGLSMSGDSLQADISNASSVASGLMSAADKSKLDDIPGVYLSGMFYNNSESAGYYTSDGQTIKANSGNNKTFMPIGNRPAASNIFEHGIYIPSDSSGLTGKYKFRIPSIASDMQYDSINAQYANIDISDSTLDAIDAVIDVDGSTIEAAMLNLTCTQSHITLKGGMVDTSGWFVGGNLGLKSSIKSAGSIIDLSGASITAGTYEIQNRSYPFVYNAENASYTLENSSIGGNPIFVDAPSLQAGLDGAILNTTPKSINGSMWYEIENNEPVVKIYYGGSAYPLGSSTADPNLTVIPSATVTKGDDITATVSYLGTGTVTVTSDKSAVVPTYNSSTKVITVPYVSSAGAVKVTVTVAASTGYTAASANFTVTMIDVNTYLTVNLPFTNSATEDLCGNSWTSHYNAQVVDGQFYSAYSNGGYLDSDNFTLGGQDFTIEFAFTPLVVNNYYDIAFAFKNDNLELKFVKYNAQFNPQCNSDSGYYENVFVANTSYHAAVVYVHAKQKLYWFIDGVLKHVSVVNIARQSAPLSIAFGYNGGFVGYIDYFKIYDGIALWTDDFTPPVIAPADPNLTINPTAATIYSGQSATATLSYNGSGTVTLTNTGLGTPTYNSSTKVITVPYNLDDANSVVTVTAALSAAGNYSADSATFVVQMGSNASPKPAD